MQRVVLHRTASLQHAPCNIHRYVDKTRARLSQEPNLTHICAWTRPHRRRDSPTSEVGHPHICAGDHLRRDYCCERNFGRAPHACDSTRAHTLIMLSTLAVFQLPMFWLNADAE